MEKFIFWWNSPCKGMIGVFEYFCMNLSHESLTITGSIGDNREAMGWDDKGKYFTNHIVVQNNKNWIKETTELFNSYKYDYIHVFGGSIKGKCAHLVKLAMQENVKYCIMTEAPFNDKFGILKVVKDVYIKYYLPYKTRLVAKKALLVFCLSGKKIKDIKRLESLGYNIDKIIPYGYWTDEKTIHVPDNTQNLSNDKISLICPGLLKAYKGVNVLIEAINILVKKGYNNFDCHIIGKGDQLDCLVNMVNKNKLNKFIFFDGVLNQKKFDEIVSKTDILVAPGYNEPWGIRINEGIQRGQVVICSDGLGASDLIEESCGGIVFESGEIGQLAKAIQYYLDDYGRVVRAKKSNTVYKNKISCMNKAIELESYLIKL